MLRPIETINPEINTPVWVTDESGFLYLCIFDGGVFRPAPLSNSYGFFLNFIPGTVPINPSHWFDFNFKG